MATEIKNIKIRLRKDTIDNWISVDPILHDGEVAIVVGSNGNENLKIGNGLSSFSQLPYLYQNEFSSTNIYAKNLSSTTLSSSSISQGYKAKASSTSLATGIMTEADSTFAVVHGIEAAVLSDDHYAFVWNGTNLEGIDDRYTSHGEGTFSINPVNGLSGLYIGEETLDQILQDTDGNVTFKTWRES